MKRIIIFTLSFLIIISYVGAQKVDFGVKAGVNETKITGEIIDPNTYNSNLGTGYIVGAFFRFHSGERFFIQPEVDYSLEKISLEDVSSYISNTTPNDIKLQYFEIPIMFGYKLINLNVVSINAFAGPVASFNTSSSSSIQELSKDQLKTTTFSWQAGGSLDLLNFVFDIRYEWGISDITKGSSNRNNLYVVSLGYKF